MTREEAIARIKEHKIIHKMSEPRAIYISEALDMAIKALEQEPCDDAISTINRQEAIDAIMSEKPDAHYPSYYAEIIKNLPERGVSNEKRNNSR